MERKAQTSLFYVYFHFQTLKRKCEIPSCALLASWWCSLTEKLASAERQLDWPVAPGSKPEVVTAYPVMEFRFPCCQPVWKAAHTKAKDRGVFQASGRFQRGLGAVPVRTCWWQPWQDLLTFSLVCLLIPPGSWTK